MGVDKKRLLLEFGKEMRELNQQAINPEISVTGDMVGIYAAYNIYFIFRESTG